MPPVVRERASEPAARPHESWSSRARAARAERKLRLAPPPTQPAPLKPVPDGFLFGAAVAGYQVERGLTTSDWRDWEGTTKWFGQPRIANGDRAEDGPDFAHVNPDGTPGGHFREYLAKAREMGHNSFRFSLEWSRIQPEPGGPYDPAALRLYHAILAECRANGLTPMVTLQHFSLPRWVNDIHAPQKGLGGWAGAADSTPGQAPIVDAFARYAGDMAKEFKGEVEHWLTLNEPNLLATGGYLAGMQPGAGRVDPAALRRAFINMAYGHARAYDAIKAEDPNAQVGLAQHVRRFEPANPRSRRDRAAAAQLDYLNNALALDAITSGNVDWNGNGKLDGHEVEALRHRLDFVGINYYTRDKVSALPFKLPLGPFKLKGVPWTAILPMLPVIGRLLRTPDRSDMGWEVYPEGMYQSIKWAADRYKLPIFITENGIADAKTPDARRTKFLLDHMAQVQRALGEGADVRGYLHWSLMDNFEWNEGFEPHFGLLRVDFADPARPFAETSGARTFSEIIRARGVPELTEAARPG